MTRATAEVFGIVEECTLDGCVRIANIVFQLPDGESAAVGNFVRASLSWKSESLWAAKEASVYDADPTEESASKKQAAAEVAQTAISNAQQQAISAPSPAPVKTQEEADHPASSTSAQAVPLRTTPAPQTAPMEQKAPAATTTGASRFGGAGAKTATPARPVAPAPVSVTSKPSAVQSQAPVAQAPKSASRFGASVLAKTPARPVAVAAAPARPAFDPMTQDDDIPF